MPPGPLAWIDQSMPLGEKKRNFRKSPFFRQINGWKKASLILFELSVKIIKDKEQVFLISEPQFFQIGKSITGTVKTSVEILLIPNWNVDPAKK